MAEQKFLGQEGTDVLVEKIKLSDVEKFVAELHRWKDVLEPYKDDEGLPSDDPNFDQYTGLAAYIFFGIEIPKMKIMREERVLGFFPPVEFTIEHTNGLYDATCQLINYFENVDERNGISLLEFFKKSPILFPILFQPYVGNTSVASIEEITAQEVSDKFNS